MPLLRLRHYILEKGSLSTNFLENPLINGVLFYIIILIIGVNEKRYNSE